jgi:multiple sugar transport system substrate-binding protein
VAEIKRKLTRRDFLRLGGLTASGAVIAACVAPAAPTAPEVQPEAPQEEAPPEAPAEATEAPAEEAAPAGAAVELTVAHAWEAAFVPTQENFDKAFTERHPDITVKIVNSTWSEHNQIVPTWAAAGQLPDMIYVHGRYALPWNFEGIMLPMQDYLDADPEFNVEDVWAEARRLYALNGKQYEIPYDHGPIIMGYNKDVFDAAGEPYPEPDWTMDDFLAKAQKLTSDPVWGYSGYYGTVVGLGNEQGIALVGPWGGSVVNDEENKVMLDSAEALAGLQFFADMIHVHKVAPTPAVADSFPAGIWIAGNAAMWGLATWGIPQMVEFGDFNWDVAPWPKGPTAQVTGSFGSGYGMTRDTKFNDQCYTYIREYLSKEGMEFMWGASGRGSPARKSAYQSWLDSPLAPEHAQYYLEALDTYAVTGRPYQTLAGGEILDIFNRNTDLIETGDASVEEAVAAIIAEGDPVLQAAEERMKGG